MTITAIEKFKALLNTQQRSNPDTMLRIKPKDDYSVYIQYMDIKCATEIKELNKLIKEDFIHIDRNINFEEEIYPQIKPFVSGCMTEKSIQLFKNNTQQ